MGARRHHVSAAAAGLIAAAATSPALIRRRPPQRGGRRAPWGTGALATLLLCLALQDVSAQTRPRTQAVYGAVAYERDSGAHGYAYDFSTERAASVAALRECGRRECEVLVAFRNGCGAVADGPVPQPIAARGATSDEAESKALKACGDPACRIVAWACTK